MDRFIYVFSTEARDLMIASQYTLVNSDNHNKIYTFLNKEDAEKMVFSQISYLTGNTISL